MPVRDRDGLARNRDEPAELPRRAVSPLNSLFAKRHDRPLRRLRGISRCYARQLCRAERDNVPWKCVECRVNCSANFGLGSSGEMERKT